MKRSIKLLTLFLVLIFTFSIFMACGKKDNKIIVNEVTHSVFYAPQYVAMELGFFKDKNIEIDLVNGGGSDKSMTALISGNADVALLGPETAVYIYNQGKTDEISVIAGLTQRDGSILVAKDPDDDFSFEKLKGKTIIGGRKGGMPNMTLEYVLKQHSLMPNEDVTVDTSISFNLMAGAFEGSDAEYVPLFEPTASMTQEQGKGYIVASIGEYNTSSYTSYMVKKSSIEKDNELFQNFVDAVYQGQKWVFEHSAEEIAKVVAPHCPETSIDLLISSVDNYKKIGVWCENPVVKEDDYLNMLDVIEQAGELEKRVDFAEIVDNSLAQNSIN